MPSIPGVSPLNPTSEMKEALRLYIVRQRQREKEEAAQSAVLLRERREREERQQRDSATLEHTKTQIDKLRDQLGRLQKEKHELFCSLKKVMNEETEKKKVMEKMREDIAKEAREVLNKVGPAPVLPPNLAATSQVGHAGAPPPPPPPPGRKPTQMTSAAASPVAHIVPPKRPRSPSPQQNSPYAGFSSPKHIATSPYRSPYQQPTYAQLPGPSPSKVPAQASQQSASAYGQPSFIRNLHTTANIQQVPPPSPVVMATAHAQRAQAGQLVSQVAPGHKPPQHQQQHMQQHQQRTHHPVIRHAHAGQRF